MPELPEVETIRRDLNKKIVGIKIKDVTVKKARLIKGGVKEFVKTLKGNVIKKIGRRGKLLVANLSNGDFLLIHLKMTGQLIYQKGNKIIGGGHGELEDDQLPGRHTHITFEFSDDSRLFFNDLRQFGYMKIADKKGLEKELVKFGIEPLTKEFSLVNFKKVFLHKKTSVKALLMNQGFIAGLGNIYADEVCFYAKIKPNRRVTALSEVEIRRLYQGCKIILQKAIKARGTTFNSFRDADGQKGGFVKFLQAYGRKGEHCKRCRQGVIIKTKQGGRGTHFCPSCQH